MQNIECENCGGTDFYKEAGFFFCHGCQVQSQEVQEYVFDDFATDNRPKATKVQTKKQEKDNKITSWECYNYILLGLTEELINLGANRKLKTVVRILWLRYLEKMGVFKLGEDRLPKLQAVCSQIDGEIVYGKLAKRKRKRSTRSSSSSMEGTTLDSSSMRQERIKRKKALVKAQYEDFSQKSQGTASLHNETLTSLQTPSEKSSKHTVPISYNIYAARELRRMKKSKYHWHKHNVDFDRSLKCHKLSYRKISYKYRCSPYILSLNKLYAILYLGLLIIKDRIQLADILRFIKEGRLSFNCYSHFFPDEFSDKTLNFRNFKKNSVFANAPFRVITSEMAMFLNVDYYVSCPNLTELCERYCRELNLPHEICFCAKNIMSKVGINMSFRRRSKKVPNYEGRVLSIIIFVIKLLFGLDDVTEIHLGKYAEILNRSKYIKPEMFNIIEWLKHIEYRDLVMTNEHFPTNFSKGGDVNVNLSVGVFARKEYPQVKTNPTKDNYKHLLTRLKEEPENKQFPVTLTPFFDYANVLPKGKYLEILTKDFCDNSLDHVLKPSQFLEVFRQHDVESVHGGANEDWVLEKIACQKQDLRRDLVEKRKLITVKLSFDSKPKTQREHRNCQMDAQELKDNFQEANESKFQRNLRELSKQNLDNVADFNFSKIQKKLKVGREEEYHKHYNPYERFWLRTKLRMEALSQNECKKFLETFPYNFQLVFKECRRIAQQSEQEFLVEYQMTELHLVYVANYGKKTHKQEILKDKLITNYLDKCENLW